MKNGSGKMTIEIIGLAGSELRKAKQKTPLKTALLLLHRNFQLEFISCE
jgi:hypothetical protein